jgi:TPR repeat protein
MTGFSGCQGTDAERSKYIPHYLSSNESGSGFESFFIFTAVVIGGMAWAIESTGVHLQPSLTIEPKERVLSPLAFSQLSAAAKRGDALAQNNFGVCHFIGQGVVQDRHLAVYWYQLSADQGFAPAQANLARCYATGEGVWRDEAEAYAYASLAGLPQPGMAELVAGLSPAVAIAGKRRAAELGKEISAKLAAKKAKDAVK